MRGRASFRRIFAPAGVAILGLLAIGVGAAIKTGFITVQRGTPAGDSTGVTVRTGAGEVEMPVPPAADTPLPSPPATPTPLRNADSVVAPIAAGDSNVIRPTAAELSELASTLIVPVAGVQPKDLLDTFDEPRGTRRHNALDIPAPRGTAVLAATDGRVRRLFTSPAGGLMIYASDPTDRFVLMYAHLDRYANGLTDTTTLRRGDTIGFVGTTGNAPPNVPHLHFAIARTRDVKKWWSGTPVDPRPLLLR
jgi:murein DD-endopeptidase MepM/ murein hydrolase activator NlpD